MQLDARQIKMLQEMGLPMSGFIQRAKREHRIDGHDSPAVSAVPKGHITPRSAQLQTPALAARPSTPLGMQEVSIHIDTTKTPAHAGAFGPKPSAPASPSAELAYASTHTDLLQKLTWQELQGTVSKCHSCALSRTRQRVSWGCHIDDSCSKAQSPKHLALQESLDWLILDNTPSDLEDQTGNPFASESGQLLLSMLKAFRLLYPSDAPSAALINTVKCHPPGGRNAHPFEVQQCSAYLKRQIELLQPKAILLLGLQTYRSVFIHLESQSKPLIQLRAEPLTYLGIPTFVTYHPASLLMHPQDKAKVWFDLLSAKERLQTLGSV